MIDLEKEKSELLRRDSEWSAAAFAGRDVEKVLSYWTDGAIVMPPGRPSIAGRDAIRAFVESSFRNPGFSIRWTTSSITISADGSMAHLISQNASTHMDAAGAIVSHRGRAVTIWSKDLDGEWRCAIDIWNAEA